MPDHARRRQEAAIHPRKVVAVHVGNALRRADLFRGGVERGANGVDLSAPGGIGEGLLQVVEGAAVCV